MGCFACFEPKAQDKRPLNLNDEDLYSHQFSSTSSRKTCSGSLEKENLKGNTLEPSPEGTQQHIAAHIFTFREVAAATQNFRSESLIGEGGFGRVYKGWLQSTGQVVAVKQLDRRGLQGNREFLVEVLMLSLLHHPNLVNLIGYCADGDQRLLVYEFMPLGCLEDHLHYRPPDVECLNWNIRMRIAAGAARGLEYLHAKANPPVIYRDFKSSNILLDEDFHPKLSDFGLAKLGPSGDKTHVSTRVMGTYGYCAPEYASTGQLTVKSDVYSFGVVLLELITGRKAIDHSRGFAEHNLVSWARPLFKDRKKFNGMADPLLCERYPVRALHQAIAVAAMCLQDDAMARPVIGDVVTALNYLSSTSYDPKIHHAKKNSPSPSRDHKERERKYSNGNDQGLEDRNQVEQHTQACQSPENGMLRQVHTRISASPENLAKYGETDCCDRVHGRGHGMQEASTARKQDVDDWVKFSGQKDSPSQQAMKTSKISSERDRERAVAEAMVWGDNWRHRKQGAICHMDAN